MPLRAFLVTALALLLPPASVVAEAATARAGAEGTGTRTTAQAVVYDDDGRVEPFELAGTRWEAIALRTAVAIVPWPKLRPVDEGGYAVDAETLERDAGVCPDVRFAGQPALAECTGTLIGDDLVLTAGHCVRSQADCDAQAFVFGFATPDGESVPNLSEAQVFGCAELVAWEERNAARLTLDHAIVRLDRAATPDFEPAPLRLDDTPLAVGTPLALVGFPDGVPVKVDLGGVVIDARSGARDYFVASVDAFGGNSGGGVFLEDGTLAGLLVRGLQDYVQTGSCATPRELPASAAGEEVSALAWPLRALCEAAPEEDLCAELPCAGEGRCATDSAVPAAWSCPIALYDDGAGCDCACGAPDPDCSDPSLTVFGCEVGDGCRAGACEKGGGSDDVGSGGGGCQHAPAAPALWWLYVIISCVMRRAKRAGSSSGVPSSSRA